METTGVMCDRYIYQERVQDGYNIGHGDWCRLLGR